MIDAWRRLVHAAGGRGTLAARLEVNESTVWRWMRGTVRPNSATRKQVNALCAEYDIPIVFEQGKSL